MEYLEFFKLSSEPFSNAPMSRFYYGSHQHSEALRRLQYVASSMKGLAICIGDIGHGKTTLARRMLDSLPEQEYEAAMLVIVHAGITANWLLKRIASQLGVQEPAVDKLTILSQLYNRLLEIHAQGKRAVVLIDEAQMLGTRELMEEFRGMLNLEVPEHKLITFIFFGLPEIENNLRLDPPLAQRIALRYHLKPLTVADTTAYIYHRLRVAGAQMQIIPDALMPEIHRLTRGVPRVVNTLCDNLLLEMFFAQKSVADAQTLAEVGANLSLPTDDSAPAPVAPEIPADIPAAEGSEGHDAIAVVGRDDPLPGSDPMRALAEPIAAAVAGEPMRPDVGPQPVGVPAYDGPMEPVAPSPPPSAPPPDLSDPLAFIHGGPVTEAELEPSERAATEDSLDYLDIEVVEEGTALGFDQPSSSPDLSALPSPVSSFTTTPTTQEFPAPTFGSSSDADDALPTFQAASSLEPSAATRGLSGFEEQEKTMELPAVDLDAVPPTGAPAEEPEFEIEADEVVVVTEASPAMNPTPIIEAEAVEAEPVAIEADLVEVDADVFGGEVEALDVEVEPIPITAVPSTAPATEPSTPSAPVSPSAKPSRSPEPTNRTVTTSTGTTIDLNEIDNLLADINSSIGKK